MDLKKQTAWYIPTCCTFYLTVTHLLKQPVMPYDSFSKHEYLHLLPFAKLAYTYVNARLPNIVKNPEGKL